MLVFNKSSFPCTYLHCTLLNNLHNIYYNRHFSKSFTNMTSFNHLSSSELVTIILLLKDGEMGTEKVSDLPKVTQLVKRGARFKPKHSGFGRCTFFPP